MSTEAEYLRTRMDLGVFKKNADLKDKFNKDTLLMTEGFIAANGRRFDEGLLGAKKTLDERDANRKRQEKERAKNK